MIHWEAHACLPLHPQADFAPIAQFHEAGVHYVSINIGMDMIPLPQVMATIAGFRATIAAQPGRYVLVNTAQDIRDAAAAGKLAIGFDLEGAMPLLEEPAMVALYRSLGVRQMHLAYNRNNSVAGGCHDVEQGLTPLGHQVVQAINAAGVLMDCSHTGRRCSLDIMAASSAPVIFSHANPLSLVEHGRNVTDEQIRACAATGALGRHGDSQAGTLGSANLRARARSGGTGHGQHRRRNHCGWSHPCLRAVARQGHGRRSRQHRSAHLRTQPGGRADLYCRHLPHQRKPASCASAGQADAGAARG